MPTLRASIRWRIVSATESGESGLKRMVIHSIGLRRSAAMLSGRLRVSIGSMRTYGASFGS
jgi:hypothetical protein